MFHSSTQMHSLSPLEVVWGDDVVYPRFALASVHSLPTRTCTLHKITMQQIRALYIINKDDEWKGRDKVKENRHQKHNKWLTLGLKIFACSSKLFCQDLLPATCVASLTSPGVWVRACVHLWYFHHFFDDFEQKTTLSVLAFTPHFPHHTRTCRHTNSLNVDSFVWENVRTE